MPKKRKRAGYSAIDIDQPGPSKVVKYDKETPTEATPGERSGDERSATDSTLSSYESSWSREEDLLIELTAMETDKNYRFSMINYMPLYETTVNHIAKEWGIEIPTKTWDIVDKKRKNFIMIRYAGSKNRAIERYYQAKAEVPNNSGLYLIKWGETSGEWVDLPNMSAQGEEKVRRFLLKRRIILEAMGINTEFFKIDGGCIQDLFPSTWLNDCLEKWKMDLLEDQFEKWSLGELYVKEAAPKTITAE